MITVLGISTVVLDGKFGFKYIFWFVKLLILRASSLFPWGKSQINMTLDAVPVLEPLAFQNRLGIKVQFSFV